ncbi:MAG: hypothetical protein Q7K55_06750 [Candidatus Levybacteria bacterium]|nr:hypothetical protein [Candidatus Levybacteria bacterium]
MKYDKSSATISAYMPKGEFVCPTESSGKLNLIVDGRFIDSYKHLNHVAWGIYLETGRIKTAEEHGITVVGVPATSTFLQRTRIDYKDQIKEGDEIGIVTTSKNKDGLVVFDQKIIKPDSSKIVGEASTIYGQPDPELVISSEQPLLDLSLKLDEDFFLLQGQKIKHLAAPACFEEERLRLLLSRGLTMEELNKMGVFVMVASIDVHYAKEMNIGQKVNIRTNVFNQGVKVIFIQQMVENGQVINEAQTIYVPIDITGEKPKIIRPPAQLMNRLTGHQIKDVPYSRDTRWL